MATSTPAPPDLAAPPEPRRETLTTIAEQIAALDTLIGLARLSIRVVDIDLSDMGWNTEARAQRIAAFLHAHRGASMEIVVHETAWAEKWCPRLTNFLKHYSHALAIYRAGEEGRRTMDPMVIVDGRHFLHRFHVTQPRASLGIEQPAAAALLVDRFEVIRRSAEPGISASVTGL